MFDPWKQWILKEKIHQAVHKKSLFPVQRVAEIMASRASAIFFFFFPHFFFFNWKILSIFGKKKSFCKNEKKSLWSHLFRLPGCFTGNIIIFMDSLIKILRNCGSYGNPICLTCV